MRALCLLVSICTLWGSDFAGTWKRDDSKSVSPAPKLTIEPRESATFWHVTWSTGPEYDMTFDGLAHPVPGSTLFDSATYTRVDGLTVQQTGSRNGQVVGTVTWAVSPDGNELRQRAQGKYPNGRTYDNEAYFKRVKISPSKDPFMGTWETDPARTKIGVPVTYTIADVENGIRLETSPGLTYTATFDGSPHPVTGTQQPLTVTLERVDPRTIRALFKQPDGTSVRTSTLAVSGDGKLTETVEVPAPAGAIKSVNVFQRQ